MALAVVVSTRLVPFVTEEIVYHVTGGCPEVPWIPICQTVPASSQSVENAVPVPATVADPAVSAIVPAGAV